MAEQQPFITGWCNDQPGHPPALHYLCRQTYTSQTSRTYVCTCKCHEPERVVRRVLR
jgi:hypothetical protein